MEKTLSKRLVVILGPTASGKSGLAIKLAKKFHGEIISADSRQVYKGLDIGTAKVTKKEMASVPHYLLDVASPRTRFSVAQYRKLALKAIDKIQKKGKIPFLVGGTGFYIQAVVDGILIPEVKPDWKLRSSLERKTTKELWQKLKKLDPRRAKTIEKDNKRRLIRALEIILKTKKPIPVLKFSPLPYPVLQIGIKIPQKELKKRIAKRFFLWLKKGFLAEVRKLRRLGLSWKRIEDFGLHYRAAARYLQKKTSYQEMIANSLKELNDYTRRQMTWFTRQNFARQNLDGPRIKWLSPPNLSGKAGRLVGKFLEQK